MESLKLNLLILIQTILNFIALDRIIFHWLPTNWLPDSAAGQIIPFIIWGILLIFSYALATRFNNQEHK
ncbi:MULTISPECIES: hypothetical protein [Vagococcus]|uniref:hypothetical protein n=1 Tax=Vagococcus TaxID=2737 RepID=UPI002FCC8891